MKVTNGDILSAKVPIERLIQCKVGIKTGFAIATLAQEISNRLIVVGAMHDDLVREYGEATPLGSQNFAVLPTNPNWNVFNEKLEELKAIEVELDIMPITLPETLEIEPAVLMALKKFIKT